MKRYEKTSLISCSLDELFEFHLDSNNIKKITPKDTKVELLSKDFVPAEGKVLQIKTTKFCVPTLWAVEISLIKKPNMLVDTAVKSPFEFWRHSHIFTKKGNVCELKDVIEYEMPFGIIGNIFSGFMQKQLDNMFSYRHKQTKMILEKKDKA
ncbi:SRPBCC family protein [Arcobacter sp.]|uniref:SRPBCC family protein n=1 Tax=unclassified Arcobacter TaxID=2593671 RepID=UPI003B00D058